MTGTVRYVITEGTIRAGGAPEPGYRVHRATCKVAAGPRARIVGDALDVDDATYQEAIDAGAAGGRDSKRLPSCCKPNYADLAAQRASTTAEADPGSDR